jgi:hypothetical protein
MDYLSNIETVTQVAVDLGQASGAMLAAAHGARAFGPSLLRQESPR